MQWIHKIFSLEKADFQEAALEIFKFQAENNPVYKSYLQALEVSPPTINELAKIPFMPIRFFKTHDIKTTSFEPAAIFESSGTTGTVNSRHLVRNISLYEESFIKGFEFFYGPVNEYCILGLLPSYLERSNSSLVFMVNKLIELSRHSQSGFYLNEFEKLNEVLKDLECKKQKTILIGVTFALLDFAEKCSLTLNTTTIMETGGMKGRRKEMIREEVHEKLNQSFGSGLIHSEYGMTELLSQAYSKGNGIYNCPPWMQLRLRDEEDPFLIKDTGSGIINVIDLANIYSCSFIATDDAGKLNADGSFEVLGRIDGSDLRGCSLIVLP